MEYKALNKQSYVNGEYSIVPIRMKDRFDIMKWRNEQMYHLRQDKPLTKEDQDVYFKNVVLSLFDQTRPLQLLFSFLRDDKCIGYGGLVHINWQDKNAEISFIMDTELEAGNLEEYWSTYLLLLERMAFTNLMFHKIFTYAFDLRPKVILVLEKNGYSKEAELKEHKLYNDRYIDVLIHSKLSPYSYN